MHGETREALECVHVAFSAVGMRRFSGVAAARGWFRVRFQSVIKVEVMGLLGLKGRGSSVFPGSLHNLIVLP